MTDRPHTTDDPEVEYWVEAYCAQRERANVYAATLKRIAASPRHPRDPDPQYVTIAKQALSEGLEHV
jgi:hypothetical protein